MQVTSRPLDWRLLAEPDGVRALQRSPAESRERGTGLLPGVHHGTALRFLGDVA